MQKQLQIQDKEYPKELKRITNPPQSIYIKGDIHLLENPKVAIIGTRHNTEYGKKMALNFAKKLSSKGYTIVSGLAKGIDSYSHIGAMLGIGKTIAILPCGFDNIYPKQNQMLYEEIIKNGGLVISEYRPNVKADKYKFPERNRIVAGISNGVLVVEGAYRSGTSATARIANSIDVPVFCIPSNLDSKKGYTPNLLIKDGNILVTNEQDIIDKIEDNQVKNNKREEVVKFEDDIEIQYINKFRKKEVIVHDKFNLEGKEELNQEKISKKYSIYSLIGNNPIHINDIVLRSNKDISQVNFELTMLMIDGYIEELPGKNYIRIKNK